MNLSAMKSIAKSIRSLSMDAVQKANSGHPGLPMGCAEIGAVLYGQDININPSESDWINRDRFVLSAGHGSAFLYSLLHLSGFNLSIDDLKQFRQVGSLTPGHPEYGLTHGVETTTGPLGQGFVNAVGMALAQEWFGAKFNTSEHKIFDHYVYTLAGDGCMMEGITSEAASFAGTQKLGRLIAIYDSNNITIEGDTKIAFTENVADRYKAYGWQVLVGDGHNPEEVAKLLAEGRADTSRPTIIILKTIIGFGAPTKAGTAGVHGAALGAEELAKTKEALGIPNEDFWVDPEATEFFKQRRVEWQSKYDSWKSLYDAWAKANPSLKEELESYLEGVPDLSKVTWPDFKVGDAVATRKASGKVIEAFTKTLTNVIGGSADLSPSNNSVITGKEYFSPATREGVNLHYGVREHAMGAIANGIALYGGLTTFCATFLVFADYMRHTVRLASLMELPVIYVFTHDSIFVGEDGPTHQPIEHVASLRMIPGMQVFRPADAQETIEAWKWALASGDAPTALILTRQNLTVFPKPEGWQSDAARGAYIAKDCDGTPDTVLVATGSEVNMAMEAAEISGRKVRVVSLTSRERFLNEDKEFQSSIIPEGVRSIGVEAGSEFGWYKIVDETFTINRFGESGKGNEVAESIGFTADKLSELI
ncbi:transketolase [Spirochaeta cellobiosiphila]|uniref:transketolase n=1 Tax=Spirochaeta cellobiosiphila TaxID=504483 RepID=UPI00041CF4CD|nr:transketolase [Spirochaeta cellobiosiphila]